jgi:hypothetical protein
MQQVSITFRPPTHSEIDGSLCIMPANELVALLLGATVRHVLSLLEVMK